MKNRILILVVLIMAVLIIAGSCATDKMTYISKEYEIYGTWVNPDYKNVRSLPKIVIHPNGEAEFYHLDSNSNWEDVDFVITNKWTDSGGNVLYTIITRCECNPNSREYRLVKISNSGKTLEWSYSNNDYPKEIDQNDVYSVYEIYYRQ
jgi:hypothetical protein